MDDKILELLSEEQLKIHNRLCNCTTMQELRQVVLDASKLNESTDPQPLEIGMSIEEFKKKYDLVDIEDLKGKYGF